MTPTHDRMHTAYDETEVRKAQIAAITMANRHRLALVAVGGQSRRPVPPALFFEPQVLHESVSLCVRASGVATPKASPGEPLDGTRDARGELSTSLPRGVGPAGGAPKTDQRGAASIWPQMSRFIIGHIVNRVRIWRAEKFIEM